MDWLTWYPNSFLTWWHIPVLPALSQWGGRFAYVHKFKAILGKILRLHLSQQNLSTNTPNFCNNGLYWVQFWNKAQSFLFKWKSCFHFFLLIQRGFYEFGSYLVYLPFLSCFWWERFHCATQAAWLDPYISPPQSKIRTEESDPKQHSEVWIKVVMFNSHRVNKHLLNVFFLAVWRMGRRAA